MKTLNSLLLEFYALKRGKNKSGTEYAISSADDKYDKTKSGKFVIYVHKGNYDGKVRGGIRYKWYVVNSRKESRGMMFDTIEDADKHFQHLLKGKIK